MANIVYNDLNKTPFIYEYKGYVFYFSSVFHRNKFQREVLEYVKNETLRFNSKYKIKVNMDEAFILSFYKKVETRGFKAKYLNSEIKETELLKMVIL